MRFIRVTKTGRGTQHLEKFLDVLDMRASQSESRGDVRKIVEKIISDVRKNGDSAVRKYTEKFSSARLRSLSVSKREIETSAEKAGKDFLKVLNLSAKRIRVFHELQKEESWYFSENRGLLLGQLIRPVERVGVYVPGGKASYPSTVLMNVIPAQVADVREIALCVPSSGRIDPRVAAAIRLLGIKEVYRIGGAQAIAAMAYGTRTIRKVDKIVGPGNIYVSAAKKMVYGDVGIDMFAGPSEILIIADGSANPSFIAADMLSQAEHDEMASSVLITSSGSMAEKVNKELTLQLRGLERKNIARKSLERFGAIIITGGLDTAIGIANRIAPEHLEIMTREPARFLTKIRNAGAVFIGEWSPETIGDYTAGPNHTLPTCGTARFSSPLGVYDFVKRSSLISLKKEGFMSLARPAERFADIEGLQAHGNSIRVRSR
jgi:histidinol dehydrogenase